MQIHVSFLITANDSKRADRPLDATSNTHKNQDHNVEDLQENILVPI